MLRAIKRFLERFYKSNGRLEMTKPGHEYFERVDALDNVVRHCIAVSRACAGIPAPTGAHYYASVLFTALCTRGVTLAMLAPHSNWAKKEFEHWDYGSAAGIVRSILEIRIALFYLCSEKVSDEEWQCRWNIFNLHDCTSRILLFKEIPDAEDQIAGFEEQRNELKARLEGNPHFNALTPGERKKFLNGQSAYMQPLEAIAERAGVELQTFRMVYRLFSSQVHGLPMAYYRMGEQDRGRGVYSSSEEGFTTLCLSFAISLLVASRDEMQELFPEGKNA
jgi:hypothetical protein